jgi:hypothetical protein
LNFKVNTPTIATVVVAIDVVAIAYVVVVADVVGVVVAVAADATIAVVAAGACVVVVVVASTNTNTNAYDVCDSYELKVEWRHQKTRMFTKLNKDRQVHISGHKVLTWEHMMPCFKPARDKGFTVERNIRGWRMEGMIPFNRNALWAKRADLLLRTSTGQSVGLSTTPSSFGPPASATPQDAPPVGATPPADDAPPARDAPPASVAPDPSPEDEDLPHVLGKYYKTSSRGN